MSNWTVAIVADTGNEIVAETIRRRLVASWNIFPAADFKSMGFGDLNDETISELDGAILVVNAAGRHSHILGPLAALEEAHVPVMALLDESPRPGSVFEASGTMVEGRSTSGQILCARLHGLLHRQREINRLWREVAVARRSYSGLRGEVDRMHEELHLAARAQREFLPAELPTLNGVTVAALWRPAQYVSGDIYDVERLDADHLGIFIADAVGHGLSAALMTMVILQSLKTKEIQGNTWRIVPPGEVMSHLNAQLIRHKGSPARFATGAYAVVDCRRREMKIAGAGHPHPLLLHADGRTEALETHGGLLGVFNDEIYDERVVTLDVGDRLLLYSDGFEQAFPVVCDSEDDLRRPTRRYRDEFQELAAMASPQEMIDRICRRLDVQSGSLHQIDDLTLVCMHAGPLVTSDSLAFSGAAAAA